MKSREILHALVIVLRSVGGALIGVALVRLLIVPVWVLWDGYDFVCGDGAGWGGVLVALDSDLCQMASAMRTFSCVMWGGLGIGLLVAGRRVRDEVVGQD